MKAKPTFSLKDQLFNPETVDYLSSLIQSAHPEFPTKPFRRQVLEKLPELELKERIVHITQCLENHLPPTFPKASNILLKSLPPELDPNKQDDDFGDFIIAPFSHYIVRNGCTAQHLKRSLSALKEITKRLSVEDAIRYFINEHPAETFAFLEKCATDPNYHVRRLASEGTRPKLPWSQKLITPYRQPLPILTQLYKDPTRYVTRSVANHLNDISKIDPDLVIQQLKDWQAEGGQQEKEMDYIVRHSLRTLIKQAHTGALGLLGFGRAPDITLDTFKAKRKRVRVGEAVELCLQFTSNKKQNLLIDYHMEFPGGRGKIFKMKQISLTKGESFALEKRHPMRLMTTRALILGKHTVTLQINGRRLNSLEFELR